MNNVYIRILTYFAGGAAFALSAMGLATFDPASGMFDLLPFNVYAAAGLISSVAAPLAIFKRWGTK